MVYLKAHYSVVWGFLGRRVSVSFCNNRTLKLKINHGSKLYRFGVNGLSNAKERFRHLKRLKNRLFRGEKLRKMGKLFFFFANVSRDNLEAGVSGTYGGTMTSSGL